MAMLALTRTVKGAIIPFEFRARWKIVLAGLMASEDLQNVIDEIRASDALVVLGAGASFESGMPLAGQLSPLVWHTLDAHPDVLRQLSASLGEALAINAKSLIGDDPERIRLAFGLIKSDASALSTFQSSFCNLNQSRMQSPSNAHTALAQLVHAGRVLAVISLNWDTLLETAFLRRYGFSLNAQQTLLWKPHGDCGAAGNWVLPHETGLISEPIVEQAKSLAAERPRVLLIIGYSERDETVVQCLIQPLSKCWRVFRVGPNATGEGAVRLSAHEVLIELVTHLTSEPEILGWQPINFGNQRGIEAAIAGERLGPRDVDACPRLPHFRLALDSLTLLHGVEIAGQSGSGKSVTVWQLAREYQLKGWQVLRPTALVEHDQQAVIAALCSQRWRTVAVVDDTQLYPREFLLSLWESANDRLKVIFGTTDAKWEQESGHTNPVRISAKASAETLANECRKRRATVLPLIKNFDSQVGDGYMDVRFEDRIKEAEVEDTPWKFAFVLRGGWRQARNAFNATRDLNGAHLLLALIAARQVATLDAGTTLPEIISQAKRFGRNEGWVTESIKTLVAQRLILAGERFRCLHLRAAGVTVEAALGISNDIDRAPVIAILQDIVRDPAMPLRGISWLLWDLWHEHSVVVLQPELKEHLLARCFGANTHADRRDASFVIERLLGRRDPTTKARVTANADKLRVWIAEADGIDAYALGQVLNNYYNDDKILCEKLICAISPATIASKLNHIDPAHGYVWGHYLGRLCVGANKEWRKAFMAAVPREALLHVMATFDARHFGQMAGLATGIAYFDLGFGLECLQIGAPKFSQAFADDPLTAYRELHDLEFWFLGEGLFCDGRPTKIQRQTSKLLLDATGSAKVVAGIVTCRFGDWENYAGLLGWLRRAHRQRFNEVVDAMDWERLEQAMQDRWQKPCREMRLMLSSLMKTHGDGEPIRSWIAKHADKMKEIDPILTGCSPEAAIAIVKHGGQVNLGGHNGNDWALQSWAIARVAALEPNHARSILRANQSHIVSGVTEMSLPDGLPGFLRRLSQIEAPLLEEIAQSIELSRASERWQRALLDDRNKERKAARDTLKLFCNSSVEGVRTLASRLLREVRYRKPVSYDV